MGLDISVLKNAVKEAKKKHKKRLEEFSLNDINNKGIKTSIFTKNLTPMSKRNKKAFWDKFSENIYEKI